MLFLGIPAVIAMLFLIIVIVAKTTVTIMDWAPFRKKKPAILVPEPEPEPEPVWTPVVGSYCSIHRCHCGRIWGGERPEGPHSNYVCPECGCKDSYTEQIGRYEWEERPNERYSYRFHEAPPWKRNLRWVEWTECKGKKEVDNGE